MVAVRRKKQKSSRGSSSCCMLFLFSFLLMACALVPISFRRDSAAIPTSNSRRLLQFEQAVEGAVEEAAMEMEQAMFASSGTPQQQKSPLQQQQKSPLQQLDDFLQLHASSPGAKFVHLLRDHLHAPSPAAEVERMKACHIENSNKTTICIAGVAAATRSENASSQTDVVMPLVTQKNDTTSFSVYRMLRFRDTSKKIASLATQVACLPLYLAGAAVGQQKDSTMVVELGPFAGFSSKCIASGMSTASSSHQYRAFDTFEGAENYHSIVHRAGWVKRQYPGFSATHSSFLQLWKDTVQFVYPTAQAQAGYITRDTLAPSQLDHQPVGMISVDSAEDGQQFKSQLEGLGQLQAGTIVFLMDFEFAKDQIGLVYGCFRERFMMPVYASWSMEHWAFVVRKTMDLNDHHACLVEILQKQEESVRKMKHHINQDLLLLSGLTDDPSVTDQFALLRLKLRNHLSEKLDATNWERLARVYAPASPIASK